MAYDGQVVINTKLDDKGLKTGITGLQNTSISALKKVKGVLATVGIGVGIATTVKGINNLIKGTASYTDRIDKMSQKVGLSRKSFQEWDFIFSDLGGSVETLETGIKTLSMAVDEAANGNKVYQSYLDRLKVSIYDTNGAVKSQEQLFNEVFTALANVENETERTNLATKLLGRSATDLAPALNAGAEEIEYLRQRAYELNTVLDDTTINIGVNFGDQVDRMKRALQTASARAIAPFMDDLADLATAFSDNVIPSIEKFMTTAFKVMLSVPPIFTFVKAVVKTVMKEIGEALEGPWTILKALVHDLLNMPIVKNTVELVLDLAGDLWAGLKKGVQSGDWSDFWKASVGAAQFAIGIVATISLAKLAAATLWSTIQTSLGGVGFSTVGLVAGAIAATSVAVALIEAVQDGGWAGFAANMTAAIAGGLGAAWLTKSPTVGIWTASILLNFKIGEKIAGGIESMLKPYQGNDQDLLQIQDIISATEGLLTKYGATGAARKKLIEVWGVDTGRQIIAGLGVGLADIDKMGEDSARTLLYAVRDQLGIKSPSTEFIEIGNFLTEGLIKGLVELFPQLEGEVTKMRDALEKIWADGEYKPPMPDADGGGDTPTGTPSFGAQVGDIWGQVKSGWTNARTEMTAEIADWTSWASNQFMQIGPNFGNAIGAGMRSLGQSIANQKEIIADLAKSIEDVEDSLADAYDGLKDAQDEYAAAVLSGDTKAIKNADKRLKQQQKLVDGYDEQLKALKDEKKSVEDGSKAWSDFAKTILTALADSLYGLGAELAARAAIAAVTFNWAGAAFATAGSAAAFGAAIAVDSWAGSYADGGIIPGTSYSGDRMVANVNSGELILNAAQQDRIAAQLAMFSRLTDLLSSMSFASGGGVTINMAGATINGLNEEAVGKAIYRNVRTLQAEGVLPRW